MLTLVYNASCSRVSLQLTADRIEGNSSDVESPTYRTRQSNGHIPDSTFSLSTLALLSENETYAFSCGHVIEEYRKQLLHRASYRRKLSNGHVSLIRRLPFPRSSMPFRKKLSRVHRQREDKRDRHVYLRSFSRLVSQGYSFRADRKITRNGLQAVAAGRFDELTLIIL